MYSVKEIADNFVDVIRNQYKYAKPTREDGFAVWNDFLDRFLNQIDDHKRYKVFKETYSLLNADEMVDFCGWINSQLTGRRISYKVLIFDILKNEKNNMKKDNVARWFLNRLNNIPQEKKLLKLTKEEERIITTL